MVAGKSRNPYGADLQDVALTPKDGAALKAWYVHPRNSNDSAIILLHGITYIAKAFGLMARAAAI